MSEFPRGSVVGLVTTATAEVGGGKMGYVVCFGGLPQILADLRGLPRSSGPGAVV